MTWPDKNFSQKNFFHFNPLNEDDNAEMCRLGKNPPCLCLTDFFLPQVTLGCNYEIFIDLIN